MVNLCISNFLCLCTYPCRTSCIHCPHISECVSHVLWHFKVYYISFFWYSFIIHPKKVVVSRCRSFHPTIGTWNYNPCFDERDVDYIVSKIEIILDPFSCEKPLLSIGLQRVTDVLFVALHLTHVAFPRWAPWE